MLPEVGHKDLNKITVIRAKSQVMRQSCREKMGHENKRKCLEVIGRGTVSLLLSVLQCLSSQLTFCLVAIYCTSFSIIKIITQDQEGSSVGKVPCKHSVLNLVPSTCNIWRMIQESTFKFVSLLSKQSEKRNSKQQVDRRSQQAASSNQVLNHPARLEEKKTKKREETKGNIANYST